MLLVPLVALYYGTATMIATAGLVISSHVLAVVLLATIKYRQDANSAASVKTRVLEAPAMTPCARVLQTTQIINVLTTRTASSLQDPARANAFRLVFAQQPRIVSVMKPGLLFLVPVPEIRVPSVVPRMVTAEAISEVKVV